MAKQCDDAVRGALGVPGGGKKITIGDLMRKAATGKRGK